MKREGHYTTKEIEEDLKKNPEKGSGSHLLKWVGGVVMAGLMVLWLVPYYGIPWHPEPSGVPSFDMFRNYSVEANPGVASDIVLYRKFVTPSDPVIKQAANIVVQSCPGDKVCYAKALFYFVRDGLQYVNDPLGTEYVEPAREVLQIGAGDCESGSILLASLLEAVGIDAQLVFIQGHAYVRVMLPEAPKTVKEDGWIYLDWTCSNCGFGELSPNTRKKERSFLEV